MVIVGSNARVTFVDLDESSSANTRQKLSNIGYPIFSTLRQCVASIFSHFLPNVDPIMNRANFNN